MDAPYLMLWFDGQALEAAELYTSLLPNSAITQVERFADGVPGQAAGEVMTVAFTLNGAAFVALNGGPHYQFTPACSVVVPCQDQAEIDRLWAALTTDGGAESQCGWLVDRFGLSWQIIPRNIADLIRDPAAMHAMLGMTKLVIADLQAAAAG